MNQGEPWIRSSDKNARLRLFCFPYAGGGTTEYRTWKPYFPGSVDICPIVLPGRETRLNEAPYHDMTKLVPVLADALWPLMRRTPYAFTGHSMGAWIAYELAREMRRRGRPQPVHLFLSARRPIDVPAPVSDLHHLPEREFVAAIQDRYNAIPKMILDNPDVLRIFLPAMRADFTLGETFMPVTEAPVDIPISAYTGTGDKVVARATVEQWDRHTTAEFTHRELPGGHFFLRESVDLLTHGIAGTLRRYL